MSRPTAEEKFNPATSPAPAEDESPNEELYRGRKKGGTKRGNVAIAPARKRAVKWIFLNKLLQGLSVFPYSSS